MASLRKKAFNKVRSIVKNYQVRRYLGRKNPVKSKPRVGFLVQMPEVWDKELDVYNELKSRESVDVVMIVVPPFDIKFQKLESGYEDNYFIKEYPDAIRGIGDNGKPIDIEKLELDYVFYQRPYDEYLPKELRSSELVKKTRCCYIPYGYACADAFLGMNTDPEFFRNIYFGFIDSRYIQKKLEKKFRRNCMQGLQHFEYLGYPSLAPYLGMGQTEQVHKILWTPRWSYDPQIGGSHFLEYKNAMVNLVEDHPELHLTIRPHPLMLDELVRKNLISEEETKAYLKWITEKNIAWDTGSVINVALEDADVLVTDFSSIMVNYFVTGKPIVYCDKGIVLNEICEKMMACMYVAHDWNDVEMYLLKLSYGDDPLKKARLDLIQQEFADSKNAASKIADRIEADYWKHAASQ